MGHIINPKGQRMGYSSFWALNSQFFFDFNILNLNTKTHFFLQTVIHDSLTKISQLTSNFLDGILVSNSLHFFSFYKSKCLLNFTVFDYMFAVFFFDGYYFKHLKRLKKLILKIKNFYSLTKNRRKNKITENGLIRGLPDEVKKKRVLTKIINLKISYFNKKFLALRFNFIKSKLIKKLLKKKKIICDLRSNLWLFYLKMVSINSFFKICSISKINNLQIVGHFFLSVVF